MGGAPRAPFLVLGHFFAVRFSATIKRCGESPQAVYAETIIQGIAGFFLRNVFALLFSANRILSFTKNLGIGLLTFFYK